MKQTTTLLILSAFLLSACVSSETDPSTLSDAQKREAQYASLGFDIAPELEVELFAAEPMLSNPTNMDIDAQGRIWVCEGYNYRMKMNPDNPSKEEGDRILILEDLDEDGQADTSHVFYQGTDINAALGIWAMGNGERVIVSCSPNIFIFSDTDGDLKADKKELLFSGLSGDQHDHGVHSCIFGPDGKLYFNFGNAGKQLLDKNGEPVLDPEGNRIEDKGKPYRQGMAFRCNLDGSEVEVLGHNFRNNYELAVDSYGNIWQSDNDDDGNQGVRINYLLEGGNYGFTDARTGASWRTRRTGMHEEIPLRHWHLNDPGVVPNLLQTGAGSPTGILVYEGELLPKAFQNQVIHSDAGPNVVRAYPTEVAGAGYTASILPLVEGAHDPWFRPSDVCVAPDGSLFISDWYDPGVGGHNVQDLARGRIFRVGTKRSKKYRLPKHSYDTPEAAVEALKSPNMNVRYLAWQALSTQGLAAESALQSLWEDQNPRFQARALWLLARLEGKGESYLQQAIQDENPDLRMVGLRAAQRCMPEKVLSVAEALADDPSPRVRSWVAIAISRDFSPAANQVWAQLAAQYTVGDRWYLEALGIAADRNPDTRIAAWWKAEESETLSEAAKDLFWRVHAEQSVAVLGDLITTEESYLRYFRALDFCSVDLKDATLKALLASKENIPQEKRELAFLHLSREGLRQDQQILSMLQEILPEVKGQRYLDLVKHAQLTDQQQNLIEILVYEQDPELKADATRLLLAFGGEAQLTQLYQEASIAHKNAIIAALGYVQDNFSLKFLADIFLNPATEFELRKTAVQASGNGWVGEHRLNDLWREGRIDSILMPVVANQWLLAIDPGLRSKGMEYLKAHQGSDELSIPDLLAMQGDPVLGKQMYLRSCSACHQVGEEGIDFGPALTEIGSKLSPEAMYAAILNPDAGISFGYEAYLVQQKGKSPMLGFIESQTEDELRLRMNGGVSQAIPRKEIEKMESLGRSLMPTGLALSMSEAELVALVSYLSSLKREI